jgi:CheY-like chemotaxis protein
MSSRRVLVIEDDDTKFSDIDAVIRAVDVAGGLNIVRAATAMDAEQLVELGGLDLMILDISLNISAGSLGPLRGGFANLGGLNVAEKMFMHCLSTKTIVVTGFDYFPATGARQGGYDLVSLSDIEARAAEMFGSDLIGCVRYSSDGWAERLAEYVNGALRA